MTLSFGSCFAGIGTIDLGLERAGMECKWQIEVDDYCRRVLAKHWPDVPRYGDIREVTELETVDVVAGGFPCQATSQAAARAERGAGWLWPEMLRVVGVVRPSFVVVENPEGLRHRGRGLGEVLSDLSAIGFDAEWATLRASDFGAPHRRARVWVVAYSNRDREPDLSLDAEASQLPSVREAVRRWADPPRGLRVDDGPRARVERLGNSATPQVAEWVGARIVEHARESATPPSTKGRT